MSAAQVRSKGNLALPLSSWHVLLGWVDLVTDIMGAISTWKLASSGQYDNLCGLRLSNYFMVCFVVQLAFLAANLLAQSALAAHHAIAATPPGHPWKASKILMAAARGLLNLELAYQEFFKQHAAHTSSREAMQHHTTAALHYKIAELIFEAPQVLISWTVLLLRITANLLQKRSGVQDDTAAWVWYFQAASAGFGLVSLSIAAMEFMRLHPLSAWASSKAPSKLLFGLIDVGESGWQSLVMGVYALCSLLNRAVLYMLCIYGNGVYAFMATNVDRFAAVLVLVIVPVMSFTFNALLLIGMKSWLILLAALISMFINIPWATGSTLQFRVSRWSSWPAWVMEFVYSAFTLIMIRFPAVSGAGYGVDPRYMAANLQCNGARQGGDYKYRSLYFTTLYTVVPLLAAEMFLFWGMAGWQSDRRRKYYKQHRSTEHMAEDLGIAVNLPACVYKRRGVYMLLAEEQQQEVKPLPC